MTHENELPTLSAIELITYFSRHDPTESCNILARRFPTWTSEQLQSLVRVENPYLRSMEAIRRGIARRIALNSPAELATFLSLGARYEWALEGHPRKVPVVERERHFLPILQAAAANDFDLIHRFAQSALLAPAIKPRVKEYGPVYGGVLALALNDAEELRRSVSSMDKCKPKAYVAGLFETLRGAASGSPEQVATGLNKVLKAYPKYMMDDGILRLVDPHAHGLYVLCRRFSEDLTSQFDCQRSPPWDAEFLAWWETDQKPLEGVNLASIDPEAHRVLIELKDPLWWDADEAAAW
jgi:hypothetical protein